MTRITLPPCDLPIPPAPIARSRASRVPLVAARDPSVKGLAFRLVWRNAHHAPAPDVAADVCQQFEGRA